MEGLFVFYSTLPEIVPAFSDEDVVVSESLLELESVNRQLVAEMSVVSISSTFKKFIVFSFIFSSYYNFAFYSSTSIVISLSLSSSTSSVVSVPLLSTSVSSSVTSTDSTVI